MYFVLYCHQFIFQNKAQVEVSALSASFKKHFMFMLSEKMIKNVTNKKKTLYKRYKTNLGLRLRTPKIILFLNNLNMGRIVISAL